MTRTYQCYTISLPVLSYHRAKNKVKYAFAIEFISYAYKFNGTTVFFNVKKPEAFGYL